MLIAADDLIAKFKQAFQAKWGYIWGAAGGIWTQKQQDTATRPQTIQYGSKWVGKRVADCSGLFSWAFKELGGYIAHGSNSIWKNYCVSQGTIDKETILKPGMAVFKVRGSDRYHIGLYIGGNKVIEAHSTAKGVMTSTLKEWHEWGALKGVSYEKGGSSMSEANYPTLKRGTTGDAVYMLQERLIALGYDCGTAGADGQYGKGTIAAVKKFQEAKGLVADGVCGNETWTALLATVVKDEPSDAEKLKLLWAWYTASHSEGA